MKDGLICPYCFRPITRPGVVVYGDLKVSDDVTVYHGREHYMSRAETALLSALVAAEGRAITRDNLADLVQLEPESVKVCVHRIRRKLGPEAILSRSVWEPTISLEGERYGGSLYQASYSLP